MNQDQIKELLLKIEDSELEFSVIFTGKKSKKVNGLYKPDVHEIILHNKNFSADSELVYTAIHEYTHHKLYEIEGGFYTNRFHPPRFWSKFHELLEKAESLNLYKIELENSPELLEITDEIRNTILVENGKLMKRLGSLLYKARGLCKKAGVRYEDYVDRVLCLPRAASTAIEKMSAYDLDPSIGYEAMKQVSKIGSNEKRLEAEKMFLQNKSPAIVRQALGRKKDDKIDIRQKLEKEKNRIEKTIVTLKKRLNDVENQLEKIPISAFLFWFFIIFISPLDMFADDSSSDFPVMPEIPEIIIKPGAWVLPSIPAPPKPPNFKSNAKNNAKKTKTQNKNFSGLTAKKLETMNNNSIMGLLNTVLGNKEITTPNANNLDDDVLNNILSELVKLNEQQTKGVSKEKPKSSEEKLINPVEILKLVVNGKSLIPELSNITCSSVADDGSFLVFADRLFSANGYSFFETLYFLFEKIDDKNYIVHLSISQTPENNLSYAYKLSELSPIRIMLTGNMLFWQYSSDILKVSTVFKMNK
ncbi:MAG: hypothetical protein CR988_03405 [Treponema sp.]|nr:MAG: hypothetical protein CR988_03405 [Treponema sp.]